LRLCRRCPQRRVGRQRPAEAMPMSAPRRKQRRKAVEPLHRCWHQAHVATRAWLDALIDQMLGCDFTQPFQRKGGVGAILQQRFETVALAGLDAHLCIDREAAVMLPLGHHLRIVRPQQSAPQDRARQSPKHAGLNVPDRGHIKCAGRAKNCTPGRIGLEHTIHHHAGKTKL